MRQDGLAPILTVTVVVAILLGLTGGAYFYTQQKEKSINSFEECAGAGNPVMESYPAQCRTKDGRHFVQQLSEEEKKKLIPPTESSSSTDETADWKTYNGENYKISYPSTWSLDPSLKGLNYVNGTEGFVIISPDYDHHSGSGYIKNGAIISLYIEKGPPEKTGLGLVSEEKINWLGQKAFLRVIKYEANALVLVTQHGDDSYYLSMGVADDITREKYKALFLKIANTLILQ